MQKRSLNAPKRTALGLLGSLGLVAGLQPAVAGPDIESKLQACTACHGPGGNSAMPEVPVLAGQTSRYIYLQLRDFKEGRRKNELMSPMAKDLTKEEMLALGDHFAGQKRVVENERGDATKVALGNKVADAALCTMCHLGGFAGQNEVPRVGGQHFSYVKKQLMAFKYKERTNDAGNMQAVVRTLPDEELEALAAYVATLK
ncbi:MAG: cytochrome c4 [Betaproteobacteria bacterium]|jgi:cytochrome c553|nr:cytochrome c4 [Betaproteobacteria bacterium]NDF71148.1 cytochrome c4 [Betaproteobacteria bacterium]